jgi:hypothetical protein
LKAPSSISWLFYQYSRSRENDVILSTMPGSGTYWMRTMLAKILIEKFQLEEGINSIVQSDIIPTYMDRKARFKYNKRKEIPRIQHSHAHYHGLKFNNRNIIFQIRDLRSVVVSHYRTYKSFKDQSVSFEDFLRGQNVNRPGQINNNTLLTLIIFLNSWDAGLPSCRSNIMLRYEDIKLDQATALQSIGDFIGLEIDDSLIEAVIEFTSKENMAAIEQNNPLAQYEGKVQKVRKQGSGNYTDYFSDLDYEYFSEMVQKHLVNNFGYEY